MTSVPSTKPIDRGRNTIDMVNRPPGGSVVALNREGWKWTLSVDTEKMDSSTSAPLTSSVVSCVGIHSGLCLNSKEGGSRLTTRWDDTPPTVALAGAEGALGMVPWESTRMAVPTPTSTLHHGGGFVVVRMSRFFLKTFSAPFLAADTFRTLPGRCLARPRAPTAARQRMALGGRQADARPRVLQARLVVS